MFFLLQGRDGTCRAGQAEKSKIVASISSFFDVPEGNENALGDALQKASSRALKLSIRVRYFCW